MPDDHEVSDVCWATETVAMALRFARLAEHKICMKFLRAPPLDKLMG